MAEETVKLLLGMDEASRLFEYEEKHVVSNGHAEANSCVQNRSVEPVSHGRFTGFIKENMIHG